MSEKLNEAVKCCPSIFLHEKELRLEIANRLCKSRREFINHCISVCGRTRGLCSIYRDVLLINKKKRG